MSDRQVLVRIATLAVSIAAILCGTTLAAEATAPEATAPEATDPEATDPRSRLESLDWLAGTWKGPLNGGTWEARYSSSAGGLVLSVNKHIVDGEVATFEYEQFRVQDGEVVMAPYPKGRPSPVVFTLTSLDPEQRRAVFENPEHDFPQILTYHRVSAERLLIQAHAWREGRRIGFELRLEKQN